MNTSTQKPQIAFFGLGTMGAGMAARLLGAGYAVTVYNRNKEKAVPLVAKGAKLADSPRAAAQGADVLIAMLADDAASKVVWLGDNGAFAAARPGAVCVDCSTISVPLVRELAAAASARKLHFLDSPVTGTKPHAANGELTFMVGGEAQILEQVRPVLAVMSKEIIHLGPAGSGAAMKLINNFVCGVQAAALAEAVTLVKRAGLNPETAMPIMLNGAPGSPLFKGFYTRQTTNDPTVYFHLELMAKDLSYAIAEAQRHNLKLTTAEAALQRYNQAAAAGYGQKDVSAVLAFVQTQP